MIFKFTEDDRAFVAQCLLFPCPLESGDFTTTVPQELVRKLRDRGISLKEKKLDEPMQIDQAVAASTCIAKSSTHLTLLLDTIVVPVLLRGLRAVMILEDMLAIIVGRDLLKALGIDPQQMLRPKLSEGLISPEFDVSGIPSIFSGSRMKSMSFDQGRNHHTILTEVAIHTPWPNHLTTTVTTESKQRRVLQETNCEMLRRERSRELEKC